jgi:multidrug efflux pump subunit AcrB
MIIKADSQGRLVRMKDVARTELGAQGYDQTCTLDGKPSVALSVYQLPGSNALDVAGRVRAKMDELKDRFPAGLDYRVVYDTTPFITESIKEVFKTLLDAVLLVAFVVLIFLQNWRSTVIPLVAVPVAIIGTFAVMSAVGFSLNNLTLFGLVLAIGIVVDDAIVVVEAVEHHIEHGMPPREATAKAMADVSGPVIAIGLVLSAVFVPCAFIRGITGQFFRQFALTIAVSTIISAVNSLTLSPALSALLLRPREKGGFSRLPGLAFALAGMLVGARLGWEAAWATGLEARVLDLSPLAAGPVWSLWAATPMLHGLVAGGLAGLLAGAIVGWPLAWLTNRLLAAGFRLFNFAFDVSTSAYTRSVGVLLRGSVIVLLLYGGLLALTYVGFTRVPTGFIPQQDKGYLLVNVQLPDASSVERTDRVMRRIEEIAGDDEGVSHTVAVAGQSLLLNANAPNFGAMYVMLKDFHDRTGEGLSGDEIAARLQRKFQQEVPEGIVNVFGAPPVDGLGTAGGFKIIVEDRGDSGLDALEAAGDKVVRAGEETGQLQGLFTSFRANTPWLYLDIDRAQAKMMGVSIGELFNTLQVYLGSLYVNDFNKFGRTWQVNIQAAADYRKQVEDIKQLKIRNNQGAMVPLSAMASVRATSGPVMVVRYNMYPSTAINGSAAPGVSSGQALTQMEGVARGVLPPTMRPEWTELGLLQLQTGNTAMLVFVLAVVLVFLVLAAQYESWALPLAVILVVPMCLLCSIAGVVFAHMDVNIFTQIGFVVLVGLACKNAILIVEYAKARHEAGVSRREATLEACKLRLRPIMMTSFAFILGVVPLVVAEGAGAEMRQTLGTAVFSGMLGVTLFGIFLTPVFYSVIQWLVDLRGPGTPPPAPELANGHAPQPTPATGFSATPGVS